MNDKSTNDKSLHGNTAKVDPKKPIVPLFTATANNNPYNKYDRYGRAYHRLGIDDEAEYWKNEVDNITKL
jgi:hypothetical protein